MSDINLRENPKPTDPDRDAVHVACKKMIAGDDKLDLGSLFKLAYGTTNVALLADYNEKEAVGVVNPFVNTEFRWGSIKKGNEFWGLLLPGTVNGMTHQWKCPAFDGTGVTRIVSEHEIWIREFCDRWNFDYDELIAESTAENEEEKDRWDNEHWITARGIDLHSKGELGEDHDMFWMHLEALTGNKFNEDHREKFGWSCSC